jgi:hypothetical protein
MNKYSNCILALGFILSSCGGGGGGGSTPSAPAPQNITVSLTSSADSAEVNSSITLTWSSTLATSCSASGAWSGSKGTSGSESITIGVGGSNTFSLSCSATGANSGNASTTVNGLRYFDGKVFDGYIRGAEVFVDTNDNLTLDANEASVTTDNQGDFTKLLYNNGTLVSMGGIDSDTGADLSKLTLVHKLEGYEASKLASPFTTLIAYMSDASTINAALGIDATIDLLTTDPIPNLGEGIYDQMYEKGNQLTVLSYTLQNHSDSVDGNSELYFQAVADQLEESYAANQTSVDIEDPAFISNVINKVETARETTFSSDVKANLNTVLSATIPLLKVYADASTTASVQRFAFSTLQNDVQDSTVIIGNASPTLLKYENNIFDYVASDQGIDEADINPNYNNTPVISSSANFYINENNVVIGNILASDPDGDSLIYSVSGSEIKISDSGQLTFVTAPDYETKNSYSATVTVSDGTDSVTQAITVGVDDVNDQAPTISSSATFSAAENQTAIGTVTASDADGDSLTYSVSGSEISISDSGQLTFVTAPDYETKNSYSATVTVSDGTNSTTQDITVNVTDVEEVAANQAPTFTSSTTFSLAENQTAIGTVTASDPDGDSLTYSVSGSEISISDSGQLTFVTAPDYETKNSYSATVTVGDGVASATQSITVDISNLNDNNPTISSSATFSLAENNAIIGSVAASDADGDSLTYSVSGSEINISSSGVLTFTSLPDYETKNSYSATVTATDGENSITQDITVNITDVSQGTYTLMGNVINGISEGAVSGGAFEALALSGDGLTIAYADGAFDTRVTNRVKIMKFEAGEWVQLGEDIFGDGGDTGFGNSVALSDDGTIVAVGVTRGEDKQGYVAVYQYNSGSWSKLGNTITEPDEENGDYFGYSVALSNDGTILAVGAMWKGDRKGAAAVYQYSLGAWTQLGSSLDGSDANDWFGRSISLSGNGTILAVGSDRHDSGSGQVRIYEYQENGSWSQTSGDDGIEGSSGQRLGRAVSLSDNGSRVAIGSSGGGIGKVWIKNSVWSELSNSMTGSNASFGLSTTLSDDGTLVTFGAPAVFDSEPSGFVQTFKYDGTNWSSIGKLTGDGANDGKEFGWASSTSNDGTIIAIGDYTGLDGKGRGAVYKLEIEN